MSWARTLRQIEAAERKQQREAQRRQKELERQAKERVKLSELEQAKWEVASYENQLEMLLSVHKDQGPPWDWITLATSLPPPCPARLSTHELRAGQTALLAAPQLKAGAQMAVEVGRSKDEQEYQDSVRVHVERLAEHEKTTALAHRIVSGDVQAYGEAIEQLNPFAELSQLGSSYHFAIHTPKVMECKLKVSASNVIHSETKALTASGKLSVKPTPRARFHEIYQDYVCGCILRVAREVFALLPVDTLLVTATVDATNPATGQAVEQPVISVVFPLSSFLVLDFDRLDPSDTVESFYHRGDFKATRKTEAFLPIVPLSLADVLVESDKQKPFTNLLDQVQQLRADLRTMTQAWASPSPAVMEDVVT